MRWHVTAPTTGRGGVWNTELLRQLKVLNARATAAGATKTRFTFRTASIDRTRNSDWYD